MRAFITFLCAVGVSTDASAQDADPGNYTRCHGGVLHDGSNESAYKLQFPTGPSDYWNNDMDADCAGKTIGAFIVDFLETSGFAGTDRELRFAVELAPGVPDLAAPPLGQRLSPVVRANDGFNDDSAYTVPCFTLGSTDVHIVLQQRPGDSHLWINADTDSASGSRTYFTSNGYAGGTSMPLPVDADLVPGEVIQGAPGELLINGSASASVFQTDDVNLLFFGPALNTQFALYLCVGGSPFLQLLPLGFTRTDHPIFGGPCSGSWAFGGTLNCSIPCGGPLEFCTLYADATDTKPNGKAKIKRGTSAFLTIKDDSTCISSCFGRHDDCVLDSTIWMIQNPAGASDWFNVHMGRFQDACDPITLAGVSVSSWDFCGFGPCWGEVGIYPSNTALDAAGCSPDVGNPIATVSGSSACMAPAAADWGCPLTFYDTPDVASDTTTDYHVAVHWSNGDTCIWLGSDTDGTDTTNPFGGCGTRIPNNGCLSLFSTNSYASPGVMFTAANWMMQLDWN